MKTVYHRWGQRAETDQGANSTRKILKELWRCWLPRRKGSGVTSLSPLMRSDSQTLSVTQTDAVSFCEEALRVALWVL